MNVSRSFLRLILYLVFLGIPSFLFSQTENHEILVNDSLHYEFESIGNAAQIESGPSNGDYIFNGVLNYPNSGSFENTLIYAPYNGFIGVDTIIILYYQESQTGPVQSYKTLVISVVEAYVAAHNDYGTTLPNTAITLDVLGNDEGSGNISLSNVALVNKGTAEIIDGEVLLTPEAGFTGTARLTYTVCDDEFDVCDAATVAVFVQENMAYKDTTTLVTLRNQKVRALFPNDNGIQVIIEPENGSLTLAEGGVYYTPDNDFLGMDDFTYAYNINGQTSLTTYFIDVIYADDPNGFVVDDYAYSAVAGSVTLNALDNDLGNLSIITFTQSYFGGTVAHLGNGSFLYTPPFWLNGLDHFSYTAGTAGTTSEETGKVYITVNNQKPSASSYDLYGLMNNPLVLDYGIPITNYSFEILAQSSNGNVVYYPGDFSDYGIQVNGQDVDGYNLIVYYPNTDYAGLDDFSIEYCSGDDCKTVDVSVDVRDLGIPAEETLCVDDCVWPGDANADGRVNMIDLLPIGYCMGEVGLPRDFTVSEFYGQSASDWKDNIGGTNRNIKHVDTDGDGYISKFDSSAINKYYGQTSKVTTGPLPSSSQIPLFFVPRTPNPEPGDLVVIDIILGTENFPATNIHGITFALNFNEDIVDPGTMQVTYENNNWLSYGNAVVSMMKEPFLGRVESGYSRTTGVAAHGYGKIGQVSFIVVEEIIDGTRLRDTMTRTFRPEALLSMDMGGQYVELVSQDFDLRIAHDITEPFDTDEQDLIAYPNPTADNLNIHVNGDHELEQIIVRSLTGQEIYKLNGLSGNQAQINFDRRVANGVYLITAICEKGVFSKKIELIR